MTDRQTVGKAIEALPISPDNRAVVGERMKRIRLKDSESKTPVLSEDGRYYEFCLEFCKRLNEILTNEKYHNGHYWAAWLAYANSQPDFDGNLVGLNSVQKSAITTIGSEMMQTLRIDTREFDICLLEKPTVRRGVTKADNRPYEMLLDVPAIVKIDGENHLLALRNDRGDREADVSSFTNLEARCYHANLGHFETKSHEHVVKFTKVTEYDEIEPFLDIDDFLGELKTTTIDELHGFVKPEIEGDTCPECGEELVEKKIAGNVFMVCSAYAKKVDARGNVPDDVCGFVSNKELLDYKYSIFLSSGFIDSSTIRTSKDRKTRFGEIVLGDEESKDILRISCDDEQATRYGNNSPVLVGYKMNYHHQFGLKGNFLFMRPTGITFPYEELAADEEDFTDLSASLDGEIQPAEDFGKF